jgi:acylphosphatase
MADTKALYARVRGRVQGVGFRWSAIREARRLGLAGWVRNDASGDVEAWAEGPEEKLRLFEKWLAKGPEYARVDSVDRAEKTPKGYIDFDAEY